MQQVNALRFTGLFNGVTGSLIGQVPYGVLTFGSYEMDKQTQLTEPNDIPSVHHIRDPFMNLPHIESHPKRPSLLIKRVVDHPSGEMQINHFHELIVFVDGTAGTTEEVWFCKLVVI